MAGRGCGEITALLQLNRYFIAMSSVDFNPAAFTGCKRVPAWFSRWPKVLQNPTSNLQVTNAPGLACAGDGGTRAVSWARDGW